MDDKHGPGTHWVALIRKNNNLIYFDSYGIPAGKSVYNYIGKFNKNINFFYNNYRFQENINNIEKNKNSICGLFTVDFIESYLR